MVIVDWHYAETGLFRAMGLHWHHWHGPQTLIGEPLPALFPITELVMIGTFAALVAALAVVLTRRARPGRGPIDDRF